MRRGDVRVVVMMYGEHLAWILAGYRGEVGSRGDLLVGDDDPLPRDHPKRLLTITLPRTEKKQRRQIHTGESESLALAVSQHPAAD